MGYKLLGLLQKRCGRIRRRGTEWLLLLLLLLILLLLSVLRWGHSQIGVGNNASRIAGQHGIVSARRTRELRPFR